jgi:hypothetical protein
VPIATTRQLERLTGVTHESVAEVAKVRKIEPTLDGAVEAVSANKNQMVPSQGILYESLRNADAPIIG